jgi:hypothetical protein
MFLVSPNRGVYPRFPFYVSWNTAFRLRCAEYLCRPTNWPTYCNISNTVEQFDSNGGVSDLWFWDDWFESRNSLWFSLVISCTFERLLYGTLKPLRSLSFPSYAGWNGCTVLTVFATRGLTVLLTDFEVDRYSIGIIWILRLIIVEIHL